MEDLPKPLNSPVSKVTKYIEFRLQGMSKKDSALNAGYSKAVASNPGIIENTEAYKQAMDSSTSEEKLNQVQAEGLNAVLYKAGKVIPDYATRHKYMVTGYELKGKLRKTGILGDMSDTDGELTFRWKSSKDKPKELINVTPPEEIAADEP